MKNIECNGTGWIGGWSTGHVCLGCYRCCREMHRNLRVETIAMVILKRIERIERKLKIGGKQ